MIEIKKKDLKGICKEIDLIIAGIDNRTDYKHIFLNLDDALKKEISYEDIELDCTTIVKIAKTKNRIIRHLEKDFWGIDQLFSYPNCKRFIC